MPRREEGPSRLFAFMKKFAKTKWRFEWAKNSLRPGASFCLGLGYHSPIDTGLCLWDTLEIFLFRRVLRVNRFRLFW